VGWSTVIEDCIVITWSAGELLTVGYKGVELVPETTEATWRVLDGMTLGQSSDDSE
jgi:hypothetical protein